MASRGLPPAPFTPLPGQFVNARGILVQAGPQTPETSDGARVKTVALASFL